MLLTSWVIFSIILLSPIFLFVLFVLVRLFLVFFILFDFLSSSYFLIFLVLPFLVLVRLPFFLLRSFSYFCNSSLAFSFLCIIKIISYERMLDAPQGRNNSFCALLSKLLLSLYLLLCTLFLHLTGGNWQKWKRVFLTCPCHKIYRDEAVGLKICKNTWKITIFVKMWNLDKYRENLICCQLLLN